MLGMVPLLARDYWDSVLELWLAARSHRKRCISLRHRLFITRPLRRSTSRQRLRPVPGAMSVLLPMTVGFGAGVLAWLLMSGDQDRKSFILTTILGAIAGTTTALFGNAAGWFQTGDAEELAGAALGAVIALVLWAALGRRSFPST